MQRPIALGCEQPVGLHHRNHVVVFDGYLEIAEADVLEHVGFLERGGDERLGRGTAVLGVQLLVERSGVDSDAQADARVGGGLADVGADLVEFADVAGIHAHGRAGTRTSTGSGCRR